MASATLRNSELIERVKQLSSTEKFEALLTLAEGAQREQEAALARNEMRLRSIAKSKGLDWDTLDDAQRLALVDDLVHETRR